MATTNLIHFKSGTGLLRYDAMCTAIAECHKVDEVKDLRDKAKAIEVYAKQAQNYDAERQAAEIRIRAERRAGELLRDMRDAGQRQERGGDRKSKSEDTTLISRPSTLADLGITRDQSSKWQQLAAVPSEEFERAVRGNGPKPTTEGIINAQTIREANPAPRMDPVSLWLWGRLKDFERDRVFDRSFDELVELMTDSMRDDALRIAPRLRAWLNGR